MLADGNGDFAKKLGLDIDLSGFGLGLRSKRYAMLVDDGVVKVLNIEDAPPQHDKSSAAPLCSMIDRSL
jgi:peroxiredoxin